MTYAFLLLLTFTYHLFASQAKRFSHTDAHQWKSDQSDFHFGFANGFQLTAGNTAVGYGFVHR